jgi:hypothetical protein
MGRQDSGLLQEPTRERWRHRARQRLAEPRETNWRQRVEAKSHALAQKAGAVLRLP